MAVLSKPPLDSDEMLFQSFRHSQGSTGPQSMIFRYMALRYGVQVNLQPTGSGRQRLLSYLDGIHAQNSSNHIRFSEYASDGPEKSLDKTLTDLETFQDSEAGRKIQNLSVPEITRDFLGAIIDVEKSILGFPGPWLSDEGKLQTRPDRQAYRVRSGMASFLLRYGRDGHPTGFREFDELYKDAWGLTAKDDAYWQPLLREHNAAVAAKEWEYLGKLCLARETVVL